MPVYESGSRHRGGDETVVEHTAGWSEPITSYEPAAPATPPAASPSDGESLTPDQLARLRARLVRKYH